MKERTHFHRLYDAAVDTWRTACCCLGSVNYWDFRVFHQSLADARRRIARPAFIPTPAQWDSNTITAAWLGQATVLINFFGVTILTDPVFSTRVGVNLGLATIGPKRLVTPPLRLEDLPPIDLILLSHAHFDHFDIPSLRFFSGDTSVVTARATGDLLGSTRLRQVTELSWGEKATVITPRGAVEIEAFEVKHWGARCRRDSHRGYNGYTVARDGKKIIFGGDTAYTPTFKPLRGKGPFALALMPIGAYDPWIWSHCTPEQAVAMANDAGAEYLVPLHHQTFVLSREGPREPLERLEQALEKERIGLREIGQTFALNQKLPAASHEPETAKKEDAARAHRAQRQGEWERSL